jgi:hypothetical protein
VAAAKGPITAGRPGYAFGKPAAKPGVKTGATKTAGRSAFTARAQPPRRAEPVRVAAAEPVILETPLTPILRLQRVECPDDNGRLVMTDAMTIEFDYEGTIVPSDDERQFVQVKRPGDVAGHQSFVRRDKEGEAAAMELLKPDAFNQMRVSDKTRVKGRIVQMYRGRDASERWQAFINERIPVLLAMGWRSIAEKQFGPRMVKSVGEYDVRVSDVPEGAEPGTFTLDFGIEIDPYAPAGARRHGRGAGGGWRSDHQPG